LKDFQQWAENYATVAPSEKIQLLTNGLSLAAERSFPLAAPDTRSRSFRIVNIDFQ